MSYEFQCVLTKTTECMHSIVSELTPKFCAVDFEWNAEAELAQICFEGSGLCFAMDLPVFKEFVKDTSLQTFVLFDKVNDLKLCSRHQIVLNHVIDLQAILIQTWNGASSTSVHDDYPKSHSLTNCYEKLFGNPPFAKPSNNPLVDARWLEVACVDAFMTAKLASHFNVLDYSFDAFGYGLMLMNPTKVVIGRAIKVSDPDVTSFKTLTRLQVIALRDVCTTLNSSSAEHDFELLIRQLDEVSFDVGIWWVRISGIYKREKGVNKYFIKEGDYDILIYSKDYITPAEATANKDADMNMLHDFSLSGTSYGKLSAGSVDAKLSFCNVIRSTVGIDLVPNYVLTPIGLEYDSILIPHGTTPDGMDKWAILDRTASVPADVDKYIVIQVVWNTSK